MPWSVLRDINPRERVTVAEFERRIQKLSRRHRGMIRQAMGTPPDPGNVPDTLWKQIEREHKAALMILLFGAALPTFFVALGKLARSGQNVDLPDDLRQTLEEIAAQRANWVAESITNTSRNRLDSWREGDMEQTLRDVFGEDRWRSIARNESVAAQSIGGAALAASVRQQGGIVTEIWFLGKCEHCTLCPMLHGTSRDFWGIWTDGPPLHPNCCCNLRVFFEPINVLRDRNLLVRRNPNYAIVNQKMQKVIRRSPVRLA